MGKGKVYKGRKYKIKQHEHYCFYCNKQLVRKRFDNGRLEDFGVFKRRKYCDRLCMRKGFVISEQRENISAKTSRESARNIARLHIGIGKCDICGIDNKKIDVHHKDHNPLNNEIDNLQPLCRSCHLKEHRVKKVCKICGDPMKGLGYCNKHYIRFRKYSDPHYTKYNIDKKEKEND